MNKDPAPLPAIAIRSVAIGLFMMSFFTGLWAGIAYGGLSHGPARFIPVIFAAGILFFIVQGIRFLKIAKRYPSIQTAEDAAEGKKMGKWFGIIFGAEGLFIFLGINIVINLGHPELIIPVIALVVGLHFYPMAWIFKRKIDYYLATWATGVAVLGIIFSLKKIISPNEIIAFVGVGLAISTICYGLYMVYYGNRLVSANPIA